MSKKKALKLIIALIAAVISNILIFKYCNLEMNNMTLSYDIKSDKADTYQVFYGNDDDWKEENSQKAVYSEISSTKNEKYSLPVNITKMRFDFGNQPQKVEISNIKFLSLGQSVNIDINNLSDSVEENGIKNKSINDGILSVEAEGNDPYIAISIDKNIASVFLPKLNMLNKLLKIFLCIVVDAVIIVFVKKWNSINSLITELKNNRELIWNLSKNDFKTKYAGSYLGITWAFIQPVVTILVYWFVFQYGLKAGSPIKDVPFVVWLVSGMIPWFFFQDALLNATNCMMEYNYLVKKVVFKISILPIVKIISALFVHIAFIIFLLILASVYGFYPTKYIVQIAYYSFCTFFITLALSYITGSIIVFFRDLGQIINIFLQVGMWATPIMWSYTIVPAKYQWIVKLNPMYYIVEGYRDTFINHAWFFQRYFQTVYFWVISFVLFIIGTVIFKRLKPHFADVL